jgi:hypothetical protein
MGLRLRETVVCVPTSEGLLFRAGDSLLPMQGADAFSWFRRLRPFLDGKWSLDQLCANLGEQKRKVVTSVLNALRDADMLYESGDDDPSVLPERIRQLYAGAIARIEAQSSRPFQAFAEFRRLRILILGSPEMALQLVQAGLEAGAGKMAVCPFDWNGDWAKELEEIQNRQIAQDSGFEVEYISAEQKRNWAELSSAHASVIIAGDAGTGRDIIETIAGEIMDSGTPLAFLLAEPKFVLVGPVEQKQTAGCVRCLLESYEEEIPSVPPPPVPDKSALVIGARLLMQRLIDSWTGTVSASIAAICTEVDALSLQVLHRPLPPSLGCPLCQRIQHPEQATAVFHADGTAEKFENEPFLKEVYKRLVDAKTGLIQQIEEGDLLQLPHHQSAALLRSPRDRKQCFWMVEIGENAMEARIAVVRRALEQYVIEGMADLDPELVLPVYSAHGAPMPDLPLRDLRNGVAISGTHREELVAYGFLQALARFAHDSKGWEDICLPAMEAGAEEDITAAYLDDIGAMSKVRVMRNASLRGNEWEVLRFYYEKEIVTIIAGPPGREMWSLGLKDVWLYVTSRQATLSPPNILPSPRFRGSTDKSETVRTVLHEVGESHALQFVLVPVQWPELLLAKPLIFAYGLLTDASNTRSAVIEVGTSSLQNIS